MLILVVDGFGSYWDCVVWFNWMVSFCGAMLIPAVNAKCGMSETATAQLPTRPIIVLRNLLYVCPSSLLGSIADLKPISTFQWWLHRLYMLL